MIKTNFTVHQDDFAKDRWSWRRYKITLAFLKRFIPEGSILLDLGTENGLGNFIKSNGFKVINTKGENFDFINSFSDYPVIDCVISFEIFEHLVNPFNVLRKLPGNKLIASVPLRLWFASAFRSKTNPAGWHFHEFEQWQFNWLLEKAGWTVIAMEKHTSPTFKIGFRSIFRWFIPRIYLVYAERKNNS